MRRSNVAANASYPQHHQHHQHHRHHRHHQHHQHHQNVQLVQLASANITGYQRISADISAERTKTTYDEHAQILRAITLRQADQAVLLLRTHIDVSKAEVRKITLHRLYTAQQEHAR